MHNIDKVIEKGANADPRAGGQRSPKPDTRNSYRSEITQEDRMTHEGQSPLEQRATEQHRSTGLVYIDSGHRQVLEPGIATGTGVLLHATAEQAIVAFAECYADFPVCTSQESWSRKLQRSPGCQESVCYIDRDA